MGMLRIPREIEMVGLDINHESPRALEADEVAQAVREEARAAPDPMTSITEYMRRNNMSTGPVDNWLNSTPLVQSTRLLEQK